MLTRKQHELLVYIDKHLRETGFSPSFDEMKEALGLRSKSGIHRLISALEERSFLQRRHHRARALEVLRLPDQLATAPKPARPPALRAVTGSVPALAAAPSAVAGQAQTHATAQATGSGAFSPTVIQGDFTRNLPGVAPANEVGSVELPLYGRIAAGVPIEAMRDQTSKVAVPIEMLGRGEHYALEVAGDSMVEAGIFDGDTVLIQRGDQAENGQIIVALVDEEEVTLKRLRRRGNSIALEPANPRHEIRIFPAERVRVQGRLIGLLRRY